MVKKKEKTEILSSKIVLGDYYKNNPTDKIWWAESFDANCSNPADGLLLGVHTFSFDKKTNFNLFQDYPYKLTKEQKEIFDKENPFWAEFFKDRK